MIGGGPEQPEGDVRPSSEREPERYGQGPATWGKGWGMVTGMGEDSLLGACLKEEARGQGRGRVIPQKGGRRGGRACGRKAAPDFFQTNGGE